MKAKSNVDPRRLLAADIASWLAVYGSASGLVDFNTFAFASLAVSTRSLANRLAASQKSEGSAGMSQEA